MNIYILCTLGAGADTLRWLLPELPIKGVIGLSRREPSDAFSGYIDMEPFCRANGLPFIPVEKYSLKSQQDRNTLLSLSIDILLVLGWQRLIPDWLINHCIICAVGVHGSSEGITGGRGRSPQNWALILGKDSFEISIFQIDPEVDSGGVFDTSRFGLSQLDDIKTSYFKASLLTAKMLIKNINNNHIINKKCVPQHGKPYYLPRRLPEDGEIDWKRPAAKVYDFIRALTRPYPGAYSKAENSRLTIWKARPISLDYGRGELSEREPGQVIKYYPDNSFIIRCGDGYLLVDDFSIESEIPVKEVLKGKILPSCDFKTQMKTIVDRHYARYPNFPLADDILKCCK